jgi:hypothetical protein
LASAKRAASTAFIEQPVAAYFVFATNRPAPNSKELNVTLISTPKKPTTAEVLPERGSFSIKEWCAYRRYSVATYYNMQRNGVAPRIIHPPHSPPRITYEADEQWVEFCNNLPADKAEKAEAITAERLDRTRKAGAAAVLSPLHCKTRGRPTKQNATA